MGFLSEERIDKASYSQYQYNATSESLNFAERGLDVDERLEGFISLMQVKSSRFLELVSTLLYFDHLAKQEQIEKVHIVKSKLKFSDAEMAEAFEFIQELEKNSAI